MTNELSPVRGPKFCGRCQVFGNAGVAIVRKPSGRVAFTGLFRCGNVWQCPECAETIYSARREELMAVVDAVAQAGGAGYLITCTLPHTLEDEALHCRETVGKAWRRVANGNPWKRWVKQLRILGTVRALETTVGSAGFHPHLHISLFTRQPLEREQLEQFEAWMRARWIRAVTRLGWHKPHPEIGLTIVPAHRGDYIVKMGLALELTAPQGKRPAAGHRTPWMLAWDIAQRAMSGDCGSSRARWDVYLWTQYCKAMHGARQLTWSKGLRELAKELPPEQTDLELVEADDTKPENVVLWAVPSETWRHFIQDRLPVRLKVLRLADRGATPEQLEAWIAMNVPARDCPF